MPNRQIKAFVTRDDFITPGNTEVSSIFELSDIANTYSLNKKVYHSDLLPAYSLHVFKQTGEGSIVSEVNTICEVVRKFSEYVTNNLAFSKSQVIILFTNQYNLSNLLKPISNFTYNNIITENNIKAPDYMTFTIANIDCSIWLSDENFKVFYPHYDVNIITPFPEFVNIINNSNLMLTNLNDFNLIEFNRRIEENKANIPTTYTRILNIPYKAPNTSVTRNCYFAFNIYGLQGDYDHILKLELYEYLVNILGINNHTIESLFPNILKINEFFIIPRWDKVAIPTRVGSIGISSQVSKTYTETFDMDKFVTVFTTDNNNNYLRNNTYNVPYDYNNILLHIVNGYYTEANVKDFREYYNDLISVTSTHSDFARMSSRTQRFVSLLEHMLDVSNCNNQTELFNNILQNVDYYFTIIVRNGITFISFRQDDHQYYLIPKYQFLERV